MAYKIGIDVGGTFTDFLLTDEDGTSYIYKILSTPKDPSIATIQGLEEMARDRDLATRDFLREVNTIVSGPAGGPVAGAAFAQGQGFKDCITCDMGGTSFDVALVKEGQPLTTTEGDINRPVSYTHLRAHETKANLVCRLLLEKK